jgi:type I restriction enzyme S subunit
MSERIPEGWSLRQVKDIATVFAGGTPSRDKPYYFNGKNPWAKSGELNRRRIYSTEEHISDEAIKNSSARWVNKDSVLIAMYGATAGKVARLKIDATINQAISAVIGTDGLADNGFLFHALGQNSSSLLNTLQGSGQPNISGTLIKHSELLVPPVLEQQKIASILTSVDDVIAKTEAQIHKLQDLKKGMMQELLTKGIGHTEFKDSPVGRIPRGWNFADLDNVAHIQTGVAKSGKLTGDLIKVPYLRVANVQDGYLDLREIKTINIEKSKVSRFLLQTQDVLVNEGGDFDKLGRGNIWLGHFTPCVHQNHVFVVRTNKKKLLPEFFNYLSGSGYGKKYYL